MKGCAPQGLLQQFREIDSDGDGFITEEEVRKFVVAMGYSCSKEAARMMVEVMNDGKGIPMVSRRPLRGRNIGGEEDAVGRGGLATPPLCISPFP